MGREVERAGSATGRAVRQPDPHPLAMSLVRMRVWVRVRVGPPSQVASEVEV